MNYYKIIHLLSAVRKELKLLDMYNYTTQRHLGGLEAYISKKLFSTRSK